MEERGWAYRRRQPEGTVLYEAVKDNLATLLADLGDRWPGCADDLTDEVSMGLKMSESLYNLKTAAQRVKTARDLLASATQSQEVAAGRYRAGVGSILDLLVAQSAYANALAQEAQARSDWFVALATLAHDTGPLRPLTPPPPPPTPAQSGGAVP